MTREQASSLGSDPQPGSALGPYVVEHFVARGGMASVYACLDTRTGERVALKMLRTQLPGAEGLSRFRREFRALSRLTHPNVLRVHEWGLWGDRAWYTMELVPGRDLRAEIEAWQELIAPDRFARVQAVLIQVLRALDYLHDRGLVHRDLTPGNIIVQPDGVVKLMDFGVVKELGSELTGVHEIMGTAAWIAPEQIAGASVDARADLYSLGAILYAMLTNRRPFQARSLQGWLDKHLHEVPRPPREIDPRVPEHLDAVCVRLLEKDPADRFASAAHLLHVLGDLDPVDNDEHWPPRLVGRTVLRARIRSLLDGIAAGQPGGAVLVQGEPGQGKTRVLDVAESQARRRGLRVVRSRATPQDGPFGAFVGVLQSLDPSHVPEGVRAALTGEGSPTRERYPVLAAFKPLITEAAPVVVILDDLHAADGASLDLLEYLVRNTLELADERVVFVLSEDVTDAPSATAERLGSLSNVYQERLGPLASAEVEELVLSLVRDPARAFPLAARLHAESNGSPAYLADMLRGLTDEGLLVRDGDAWRVTLEPEEITRSRLPMPASLRQALLERLEPLSPHARELGHALAIARRPVHLDVLVAVAPFGEDRVIAAVDELVKAGIAQDARGNRADRVQLAHQRFRDVLLETLDDASRRARHQSMGEALERFHRKSPGLIAEELTFHFQHARLPPKAFAYLLRTARRRLDASLWDEALGFLDRAAAMEPRARPYMLLDDADRSLAEVHLGRSQCLAALGRVDQAITACTEATRLAEAVHDPVLESRALVEMGQQLRGRGELDKAEPWLRRGLARATEAHDPALRTSPLYQLAGIHWVRGELGEAEDLWQESLETALRIGDERASGFGYNGLGILAICTGQTMEARRHLEQSAALFERLGMLAPLTIARLNLAELYHSTGILKKSLTLAERTLAQAREVHHPLGIALGLAHRARALTEIGRLDEALHDATDALRRTVELQAGEDEVMAAAALAQVHLALEDDEAVLQVLDDVAPRMGSFDTEGIGPMMQAWRAIAMARLGEVTRASAVFDPAGASRTAWPLIRVRTDLATAQALRALGQPSAARALLQRALQTAEASGYRLYQLLAHQALSAVAVDESTQARHERVASALARSLAANLPKTDGVSFLERGWGGR